MPSTTPELEISNSTLQNQTYPLVHQLAEIIISAWQEHFQLSPFSLPEGLGYVEGRLEGEKITIENRCYQTSQFRKLHLELAQVGKNLHILHCVMFPKPEYTLPIFGCDVVAGRGQVSAAIADLSPLNRQLSLPEYYHQALTNKFPEYQFSHYRELPHWADIFSEFCLFIKPQNKEEEDQFLSCVATLLNIHCQRAKESQPVASQQQEKNLAGQQYYCQKQQQNDKTRRVLEKAFGPEWAEAYVSGVLFDIPE